MTYTIQTHRNKYNAKKTEVDGHIFDSRAESLRYCNLLILQKAGEITGLILQPVFPLIVNGHEICKYIADFEYKDASGNRVVEDVKGVITPSYRIKKKLVKALYNVDVVEVK